MEGLGSWISTLGLLRIYTLGIDLGNTGFHWETTKEDRQALTKEIGGHAQTLA
jgi:hypothetical protein